ncbi:MAG: methyltransferase domain-containing protein [Candidatus Puniceispirillaceae bacterium]
MKFDNDVARLQRLMAASIAGIGRRKAILDALTITPGDRIIDIGCGAGQLLGHLAKAVGESGKVIGLDPSADQLAQAKIGCSEFANISFLEKGADDTGLTDNSCDAATSTQALEYIPDVDAALSEIRRILKLGASFVNISILWDHFRFHGAEESLNNTMHDAFRAHCSHQMLPMELPGKLGRLGFTHIKDTSLAFVITRRDRNSPALYTETVMANFALSQGVEAKDVEEWRAQLARAEKEGRFGFASFPVLTTAYLSG